MATLTLDGLNKTYPNGHVAIEKLSMDIADGEFIVIVGPSGCGKSSLLRMLAGLETISDGRLLIDDECVNNKEPLRLGLDIADIHLFDAQTNQRVSAC